MRGAEVLLGSADLREHLDRIRAHDARGLRHALTRLLARYGVGRFVVDVVVPLNVAVGDAWMRGQMEIFEEHMYTEAVQVVLRQAIAGDPRAAGRQAGRVCCSARFPASRTAWAC